MQPRPWAETVRPLFPNWRVFTTSPSLVEHGSPDQASAGESLCLTKQPELGGGVQDLGKRLPPEPGDLQAEAVDHPGKNLVFHHGHQPVPAVFPERIEVELFAQRVDQPIFQDAGRLVLDELLTTVPRQAPGFSLAAPAVREKSLAKGPRSRDPFLSVKTPCLRRATLAGMAAAGGLAVRVRVRAADIPGDAPDGPAVLFTLRRLGLEGGALLRGRGQGDDARQEADSQGQT
jgi:hypothetical protein